MDDRERSRIARLITYLIVGVIVVLLMRLLVGMASWLFGIIALVVIGWLTVKLWDRYHRGRQH